MNAPATNLATLKPATSGAADLQISSLAAALELAANRQGMRPATPFRPLFRSQIPVAEINAVPDHHRPAPAARVTAWWPSGIRNSVGAQALPGGAIHHVINGNGCAGPRSSRSGRQFFPLARSRTAVQPSKTLASHQGHRYREKRPGQVQNGFDFIERSASKSTIGTPWPGRTSWITAASQHRSRPIDSRIDEDGRRGAEAITASKLATAVRFRDAPRPCWPFFAGISRT